MRYKAIKNLEPSHILYTVYCCYCDYLVAMDTLPVAVTLDRVDLCEWHHRRVGLWCTYRHISGKVSVLLTLSTSRA